MCARFANRKAVLESSTGPMKPKLLAGIGESSRQQDSRRLVERMDVSSECAKKLADFLA
jgi:hypothetical protein